MLSHQWLVLICLLMLLLLMFFVTLGLLHCCSSKHSSEKIIQMWCCHPRVTTLKSLLFLGHTPGWQHWIHCCSSKHSSKNSNEQDMRCCHPGVATPQFSEFIVVPQSVWSVHQRIQMNKKQKRSVTQNEVVFQNDFKMWSQDKTSRINPKLLLKQL